MENKLEKFYKEAQEDFSLTIMNMSEKSKEISSIKGKWLYAIVKEENLLKKMRKLHQEYTEQLASFNRKLSPGAIKFKTASDKNADLAKLAEQIAEQEEVVRFLHLLLDNQIKSITWDIKNAIEQTKLECS